MLKFKTNPNRSHRGLHDKMLVCLELWYKKLVCKVLSLALKRLLVEFGVVYCHNWMIQLSYFSLSKMHNSLPTNFSCTTPLTTQTAWDSLRISTADPLTSSTRTSSHSSPTLPSTSADAMATGRRNGRVILKMGVCDVCRASLVHRHVLHHPDKVTGWSSQVQM